MKREAKQKLLQLFPMTRKRIVEKTLTFPSMILLKMMMTMKTRLSMTWEEIRLIEKHSACHNQKGGLQRHLVASRAQVDLGPILQSGGGVGLQSERGVGLQSGGEVDPDLMILRDVENFQGVDQEDAPDLR